MSSFNHSAFVLKKKDCNKIQKNTKHENAEEFHCVTENCGDDIPSGHVLRNGTSTNCKANSIDAGNIEKGAKEYCQWIYRKSEIVEQNISEGCTIEMGARNNLGDVPLRQRVVPFPVHMLVSTREGEATFEITCNQDTRGLVPGDFIHIAHPYYSHQYLIKSVTNNFIQMDKEFDYTPFLMKEIDAGNDTIERLHNPNRRQKSEFLSSENVPLIPLIESSVFSSDSSTVIHALTLQNMVERTPLRILQTRVWRLVPVEHDKRILWRRLYDNGTVPWYQEFNENSGIVRHLNVDIKLCDLEKHCFDSFLDPDQSIHQQRVHYFEKVNSNEIILETFKTICDWHPKGSTIDIFKWTKLARSMKFLSTIRNSNHEVNMAFFRHQSQRKLTLEQFYFVLKDMAKCRFPLSRYDESEALSQLLWTTVVNIPQVNRMIWTKAKYMAMKQELKYLTAEIRISAYFRMWKCKCWYDRNRIAAIMISKWTRKTFAKMKFWYKINLAKLDFMYRRQYYAAVICQTFFRMYSQNKRFLEYKSAKIQMHQMQINSRWKYIALSCLRKRSLIMYMERVSIQSFPANVSLILHNDATSDEEVKLSIRVQLCSTQEWFEFKLTSFEIKRCLEEVILRKGPLSRDQLFTSKYLRMLMNRLVIVCKSSIYSVEIELMGIVENGDLMLNVYFDIQDKVYFVSVYRSSESIILHLFDEKMKRRTRIVFLLQELAQWLDQYERETSNRPVNAIQIWTLAEERRRTKHCLEKLENIPQSSTAVNGLHKWLQKGEENCLVSWLVKRIRMEQHRMGTKIILEYEILSDVIEKKATICQSWWRSVLSLHVARKQVHLQYEKQYHREKKVFFYVHIRTGDVLWTKPRILKNNDDITDPPDEWRFAERRDGHGTTRRYYYNPFTGQSSWISEIEAATKVQKKFRERQNRILFGSNLTFDQIVKAILFIRDVEIKYMANPSKLSNIVNFALLNHFIRLDIKLAKILYNEAMAKSPNHPVISRSYGIFILSTAEFPFVQTFEKASILFREASEVDPKHDKFKTTKENFIFWAMLLNPNESQALVNYALLHQCILGEYYLAEKIYHRALALDPNNQVVVENYKMFIDQRYPGGLYAGNGLPNVILRRSIVEEERYEWGEFIYMKDPLSHRKEFSTFWFNTLNGSTRFEEPEWKTTVWIDRIRRSVVTSTFKSWVEYHDNELQRFFVYNKTSNEYTWKRK
jgi:hypothetical protein